MKIFFAAILIMFMTPAFAADPAAPAPLPLPVASPTTAATMPDSGAADDDQEVPEQTLRQIAVLISSQIRPCWKIPASKNAEAVEAMVNIDQSGNLKFVEFTSDIKPDQKELAKSVKEAIADPKCNPIKNLPPAELYYVWQNLALLFSPKN